MSMVIDTSLTIAWLLPDEGSERIDRLFEALMTEGAIVPGHWKLEVANTLVMAERRGRIDGNFRAAAIADLSELGITIDDETAAKAWSATIDLATRQHLTVYDAAYLELARRMDASLGTLDRDLAIAARAEGVRVLDDPF